MDVLPYRQGGLQTAIRGGVPGTVQTVARGLELAYDYGPYAYEAGKLGHQYFVAAKRHIEAKWRGPTHRRVTLRRRKAGRPHPAYGAYSMKRGRKRRVYTRRPSYSRGGGEMKAKDYDLTLTPAALDVGSVNDALPTIIQGTERDDRIGRQIFIRKIMLHGRLTTPLAANETQTVFWVKSLLLLDKQCNKALPLPTDIMQDANSPVAIVDPTLGFRNLDNSQRFVTLYKKVWCVNANKAGNGTTTVRADMGRYFEYYKDCNIKIEYNSDTGLIGTRTSNNLVWWHCWFSTDVGSAAVGITIYTRLRFTDGR